MVSLALFSCKSSCKTQNSIFHQMSIPSKHLPVQNRNRNTRKSCELCSKVTMQTPEKCRWHFIVFIVNFGNISHIVLVFLLLAFFLSKLLFARLFDYTLSVAKYLFLQDYSIISYQLVNTCSKLTMKIRCGIWRWTSICLLNCGYGFYSNEIMKYQDVDLVSFFIVFDHFFSNMPLKDTQNFFSLVQSKVNVVCRCTFCW